MLRLDELLNFVPDVETQRIAFPRDLLNEIGIFEILPRDNTLDSSNV